MFPQENPFLYLCRKTNHFLMRKVHILFLLLLFATLCKSKTVANSDSIYLEPEIPAQYEGGTLDLISYLSKKMADTHCYSHAHIIGQIIVEKDGSISNVRVRRNFSDLTDSELKTIIYEMPKWKCAVHNGQKVRSYTFINLHVTFQFSEEEIKKRERECDSIRSSSQSTNLER